MEIIEFQVPGSACRCVDWKLPDHGWDDVALQIDIFLAHSIKAIATEHGGDPAQWLEINRWADSGTLIVYATEGGPYEGRETRLQFTLCSDYLEGEFQRVSDSVPPEKWEEAFADLDRKVWVEVGNCIRTGQAGRELAEARKVHPLRLAAYDYDFGEGLFHLSELDEEAAAQMQQELARFKREHGVGA